jgi:hypothetical protein
MASFFSRIGIGPDVVGIRVNSRRVSAYSRTHGQPHALCPLSAYGLAAPLIVSPRWTPWVRRTRQVLDALLQEVGVPKEDFAKVCVGTRPAIDLGLSTR